MGHLVRNVLDCVCLPVGLIMHNVGEDVVSELEAFKEDLETGKQMWHTAPTRYFRLRGQLIHFAKAGSGAAIASTLGYFTFEFVTRGLLVWGSKRLSLGTDITNARNTSWKEYADLVFHIIPGMVIIVLVLWSLSRASACIEADSLSVRCMSEARLHELNDESTCLERRGAFDILMSIKTSPLGCMARIAPNWYVPVDRQALNSYLFLFTGNFVVSVTRSCFNI